MVLEAMKFNAYGIMNMFHLSILSVLVFVLCGSIRAQILAPQLSCCMVERMHENAYRLQSPIPRT